MARPSSSSSLSRDAGSAIRRNLVVAGMILLASSFLAAIAIGRMTGDSSRSPSPTADASVAAPPLAPAFVFASIQDARHPVPIAVFDPANLVEDARPVAVSPIDVDDARAVVVQGSSAETITLVWTGGFCDVAVRVLVDRGRICVVPSPHPACDAIGIVRVIDLRYRLRVAAATIRVEYQAPVILLTEIQPEPTPPDPWMRVGPN
jgi:hypothetical protein